MKKTVNLAITGLKKSGKFVISWDPNPAATNYQYVVNDNKGIELGRGNTSSSKLDLSSLKSKVGSYTISVTASDNKNDGPPAKASFTVNTKGISSLKASGGKRAVPKVKLAPAGAPAPIAATATVTKTTTRTKKTVRKVVTPKKRAKKAQVAPAAANPAAQAQAAPAVAAPAAQGQVAPVAGAPVAANPAAQAQAAPAVAAPAAAAPAPAPAVVPPAAAAPAPAQRRWWLLGAIVAGILLLLGGFWLLHQQKSTPPAVVGTIPSTTKTDLVNSNITINSVFNMGGTNNLNVVNMNIGGQASAGGGHLPPIGIPSSAIGDDLWSTPNADIQYRYIGPPKAAPNTVTNVAPVMNIIAPTVPQPVVPSVVTNAPASGVTNVTMIMPQQLTGGSGTVKPYVYEQKTWTVTKPSVPFNGPDNEQVWAPTPSLVTVNEVPSAYVESQYVPSYCYSYPSYWGPEYGYSWTFDCGIGNRYHYDYDMGRNRSGFHRRSGDYHIGGASHAKPWVDRHDCNNVFGQYRNIYSYGGGERPWNRQGWNSPPRHVQPSQPPTGGHNGGGHRDGGHGQ